MTFLHRENDELLRALAETIPQIVWTATPDGKIEFRNHRSLEYAIPGVEMNGWGWIQALHCDDLHPTLDAWNASLRTGQPFTAEYRLRRQADGMYRWQLARAVRVGGPSCPKRRWFGTWTDIHDQKLNTKERLGVASHELRTPLSFLKLQLELLSRERRSRFASLSEDELERMLEICLSQTQSLESLIDDLLDMSAL